MSDDTDDTIDSKPKSTEATEAKYAWGARNIGKVINRSRRQVYHLNAIGALSGAVVMLGRKTMLGDIPKLRALHLSRTKK